MYYTRGDHGQHGVVDASMAVICGGGTGCKGLNAGLTPEHVVYETSGKQLADPAKAYEA
jgi:hypothetical protein